MLLSYYGYQTVSGNAVKWEGGRLGFNHWSLEYNEVRATLIGAQATYLELFKPKPGLSSYRVAPTFFCVFDLT